MSRSTERKRIDLFLACHRQSIDRQTKTKIISDTVYNRVLHFISGNASFLADRTNGRAYATVLCLSVRPSVRPSVRL